MSKFFPYSRQSIDTNDIQAVEEALRSDFITQGPRITQFEEKLAAYCGSRYAAAFSSGTAALHGAYFAAGLQPQEELITSPITFLATSNAALFLGGKPVFVDIEADSGNIDCSQIEKAITPNTKILCPVHYSGNPAELSRIQKISQKHNLIVIEDACHAFGAKYKNEKIGSCRYSEMTVFSFHPVKPITTGEGGAVLTNHAELYEKLKMFRMHGVTKDPKAFQNKDMELGPWYYEMHTLGYNYRITDIQAALGSSQLEKIEHFLEQRHAVADLYNKAFEGNKFFDIPVQFNDRKSSLHLYAIRLKDHVLSKKSEIFTRFREQGLGVQVHYIPVHLQPFYRKMGYAPGSFPKAENFYAREISLPISQSMSQEDVATVIRKTLEIFQEFQ